MFFENLAIIREILIFKIKLQILLCFITNMAELVDACGLKPHPLGYRFDSDYEYIFNI